MALQTEQPPDTQKPAPNAGLTVQQKNGELKIIAYPMHANSSLGFSSSAIFAQLIALQVNKNKIKVVFFHKLLM